MTIHGSLALCMWEMGVQLEDRNSYVILLLTPESKPQLHVIEMEPCVSDAKEAVFHLFGLSDPFRLSFDKPRPSLKQLLGEINPARLFNPNYIPSSVIMPKNTNEICLCMEKLADSLQLGLLLANSKPATVIIKCNDETKDLITQLFGYVCVSYISYGSLPKGYIGSLGLLLSYAMSGDFGVTGEELSGN
jgi:hypothetical protein